MSETTEVKGQFGLGQSGGTGKKLKINLYFTDMSSVWKYPTASPRKQELLWMNIMWSTHDQFCECNDPVLHLMILINKDSNFKKPTSEIKNIKCLLTGAPSTTTAEEDHVTDKEDYGILDGELEQLFAEPDTEEKDSTKER